MPETATREGVAGRRQEAMAAIVKQHEAIVDQEMKDGGTPEGIAVMQRDAPAATVVVKPEGVDQAEWDKLDAEAKAGLAEAEAERVKAEAAAAAGETEEARAAREAEEKKAKDEADRKAAEAAAGNTGAGSKKVKIKVDDQDVEVEESQLVQAGIRTLQKESAADKRLEEASRLFKEAQAAVAAAQQGKVQEPNNGGASPPAGGSAAEVLSDGDFIEAVKKLQYGSEAEATAVLKDLITKAARSGQSEQLTLGRVAEMLDFREATAWAHDEYKDILGDQHLKTLFINEEKRLRAAGDNRPYRELYQLIGDGLREWRKQAIGPAPEPKLEPGNSLEARRERKASVVVIPNAGGRPPATPQPKEPSASDTIDKMRAHRDRQAGRSPS